MKKILFLLFFLIPSIGYCQDLSISQISFDGTDEWVSITNVGENNFTGSVVLSGAKSSPIDIELFLPVGETYFITDSLLFTGEDCNYISGAGLSLSDTKEITLSLLYGSGSIESYIIPQEVISYYNNKEIILENSLGVWTGTLAEDPLSPCVIGENGIDTGVDPPIEGATGSIFIQGIYPFDDEIYTEHLWFSSTQQYSGTLFFGGVGQGSSSKEIEVFLEKDVIYTLSDNNLLGSSYVLPSISLTNTGEEITILNASGIVLGSFIYTGSVGISPLDPLEIEDDDEILVEEIDIPSLTGLIINEIQPYSDGWGEYIELTCLGECFGKIFIQGVLRGEKELQIDISLKNGELFIVTGNNSLLPIYIYPHKVTSFSLPDSGREISLYGQDGQLIDRGVYSGGIRGKSFNRDDNGGFASLSNQTPGIDASYFMESEIENSELTTCGISIQNKAAVLFPKKFNPIVTFGGKNLSNSNKSYSCVWDEATLYDGVLNNCNPGYGGFEESGIFALGVHIYKDGEKICSTSLSLNYPQEATREPNKTNYYKGLYNKRKDKYTLLKTDLKGYGITISSSGAVVFPSDNNEEQLYGTGIIIIESILPNPAGSDTGNERITLKNISNNAITLSKTYSKRGTQKKLLTKELYLPPGEKKEYVGSFGFLNKASCIDLYANGLVYDTFCYTQAGDDELKLRLETILEKEDEEILVDSGKYGLLVGSGSVCLTYNSLELSCKALPYNTEEVSVYKKEAKKYLSTQKKFDDLIESMSKQKKNYKDLRKKFTLLEEANSLLKKEYKMEIKIRNDLIYYRKNKLQGEWNTIYSSNGFSDSYNGFTFLLDTLGSGKIGPLDVVSIKEFVSIKQGNLLLESYNIKDTYSGLAQETTQIYKGFLENLAIKK